MQVAILLTLRASNIMTMILTGISSSMGWFLVVWG